MIALPAGTKVYAHGREWMGEIPAGLCPDHLKPAPVAPGKANKEAQAKDAPGV